MSFDPNVCSRNRVKKRGNQWKKNLYPFDLEDATEKVSNLEGGILIQLSTYSANGGNSQEKVIESVDSIMESSRFKRSAVVRVNGNMMSLVYARNFPWAAELADLPDRFTKWLP